MIYLYDGSFEGLLTCVFEAYAAKKPDISIIPQKAYIPSFLEKEQLIETDMEKFRRVYESIPKKISPRVQKIIYRVWLSEDENASNLVYKFLRIGYKIGDKVVNYIQEPAVNEVIELNRAVGREAHRFLGLLRFREIHQGILTFIVALLMTVALFRRIKRIEYENNMLKIKNQPENTQSKIEHHGVISI
jgi:probable DNA metabolism protein